MGDEADADWHDGLVEWGIEDAIKYYGGNVKKKKARPVRDKTPVSARLKPGDRVVTNAEYAALFAGRTVRERGVILSTVPHIPGAWAVRFDVNTRRPQHVHEKFLQREE